MIMEEIAMRSRECYQRLVQDLPRFTEYFEAATPADVIERLGSRELGGDPEAAPAEDAVPRAVPWDFAWAQSRCLLPEWFGVATALAHALEQFGDEALHEMYAEWYFFRVLMSDIEAGLAKADLDIAERYSELAGTLHSTYFPTIRAEYDHCVALVQKITGHKRLLEGDDTLRRAIRLRNPYVDPMSLLQIDLLKRWRSGGRSDDAMLQALFASVNGIAYGMQNIG
jgi:phosphoenolpyruvate carboxylase